MQGQDWNDSELRRARNLIGPSGLYRISALTTRRAHVTQARAQDAPQSALWAGPDGDTVWTPGLPGA